MCGPNSGGVVVTYACPKAVPVPKCYRFDEAARVWTTDGTRVVGVGPTSVNCSTVHVADHAVRFVTLPQVMGDVFYKQGPLTQVSVFYSSPLFYVTAAVVFALCAAGALLESSRYDGALRRWAAALAAHPEVAWLKLENNAKGAPFSLLPPGRGGGARVAPGDEEAHKATSRRSANVAPASPALGARAHAPAAVIPSSIPLCNAFLAAADDFFAPRRAASVASSGSAPPPRAAA